jgi:GT2 family glycosyltransferase
VGRREITRNVTPFGKRPKPIQEIRNIPSSEPNQHLRLRYAGDYPFLDCPLPRSQRSHGSKPVSVIVPILTNSDSPEQFIKNWIPQDDVELMFVDDATTDARNRLLLAWGKRPDVKGRLLVGTDQAGFTACCNAGAARATGDVLVFLDVNTSVTKGWLEPLLAALQEDLNGVVSPLLVVEGGLFNETVASGGLEWNWRILDFLHLGRNVQNGAQIWKPQPADQFIFESSSPMREAVARECFAVRRSLFESMGGFHPHYGVGDWQHVELCFSLRELGYRSLCLTESIVKLRTGDHRQDNNRSIFMHKWINSGRIDALVKDKRQKNAMSGVVLHRNGEHGKVLNELALGLRRRYRRLRIYVVSDSPPDDTSYIDQVVHLEALPSRLFQTFYNLNFISERRPHLDPP